MQRYDIYTKDDARILYEKDDEYGDWVKYEDAAARIDSLEEQINALANYIMREVDGEPSQSQGAVDTAIRIMTEQSARISKLEAELAQRTADTNAMVGNCEARIAELEAQNQKFINHISFLQDKVAEFESALAAAQERERWIPVTEPPKHNNYVDVVSREGNHFIMQWDGHFCGYGPFKDDEDTEYTHWRELPALPEADHA